MNQTTEHTESTEPAAWRSRWYSAAKRFGLTVAAIVGASMLFDVVSVVLLGIASPAAHWGARALQSISLQAFLWNPLPIAAAAWGFLRPRRYSRKPPLVNRVFVVGWAAVVLVAFALSVLAGYLLVLGTDRSFSGDRFTPGARSFCERKFHLVPDADWRPAGLRVQSWQDSMAQAKFVTDETDLAHLFDTNAVDLSGVVPGGTATNIRPIGRDGPRWWTPSDAPLQAGKLAFRDPEEAARANCEVAVHALPDGSRALYIFWFTD